MFPALSLLLLGYIHYYQNFLSNCFVGTVNEDLFANYSTVSYTINGAITENGSDSLKLQISETGDIIDVYWSKILSNLIIRELDGWQYFFEERE